MNLISFSSQRKTTVDVGMANNVLKTKFLV